MTTLLHINASARGAHSQSRALARTFIDGLTARDPELTVDTLDLFDAKLPDFGTHAAEAKLALFTGRDQTPEQLAAWEQARTVFDRFAAADLYVLNIPIWNAGVPYIFKQWVDIVTQPGWAFNFDPQTGYSGLLGQKRAVTVYTSGVHQPGVPVEFGSDFATPFVADWLNFVGIKDISEIRFAPTVLTENPEAGFAAAQERARELALGY
ncbi:flavodoxin family protein [Nocardia yunnanensis]|uniref:FMN dependent NADH:quinone oxidoreductase n=1 Tax=Nocardia yunnanensis TaxID=2382165 RepID=A0A386ZLB1_9NOCA|nr:NAD(P)H-dependent oxidoreductase [Nocardia yunnanensis]AYF78407.1 flavodoxin family protein [Nocardia yunnanensis]